jgi:hypothetical protein
MQIRNLVQRKTGFESGTSKLELLALRLRGHKSLPPLYLRALQATHPAYAAQEKSTPEHIERNHSQKGMKKFGSVMLSTAKHLFPC